MKRIVTVATLLFLGLLTTPASAQTPGGAPCQYIASGAVLTPAQWNFCFQIKQDFLGYTPVNKAGDTMQGELITFAASAAGSGFNLQPGAAPTTPNNGDVWLTSVGVFARVNGATLQLTGAGSGSFTATNPLAVSFPSAGVVKYALNFNTSLALDGGNNLGLNLGSANTYTATQTFPNNSLTLAEFPTIGANTVIGSIAGGTPASLSQTQLTSLINPATASLSGALPAWPNNTTTFFRGDGSYQTLNFAALGGQATLAQFPTGVSDTTLGYFGSTVASAIAINNCSNALTYSTTTHAFGCNSSAGTGTVTSVACNGVTITASGTCPPPFEFSNCALATSVASNILTVAIKDNSGADPSASSPCRIVFRNATASTGSWVLDSVTSALSISTNAIGATLGAPNNAAFRIWVGAFDNGGTVVPFLYNASVNSLTAPQCFAINEGVVQSSTAISGSATSAGVFYTPNGTTLSNKAIKILGYVEYNSTGLVTSGTYATAPNFIQTFGPGIKRPCEEIQSVISQTTSSDTGTTNTSFTASSFTGAITPTSAANLVEVTAYSAITGTGGTNTVECRVQRSTTWTGSSEIFVGGVTGLGIAGTIFGQEFPNSTSSLTYTLYRKTNNAATTAVCPQVQTQPVWMKMIEKMGALPEIIPDNDNDPRMLHGFG